jgi:hypothetical protein
VTLGLTTQLDLDREVSRAAKEKPVKQESHSTLLPASETTARAEAAAAAQREEDTARPKKEAPVDIESVFAKLGGSKKSE